jgi:hypothetical protein
MLLKSSVLVMGAGLMMAQHGGGGGGSHGGGFSGGGGVRSSSPAARFNSGYQTSITPSSYSGHLTLSTPSLTPSNLNRGGYRPVGPRPVGVRPPIRRPGGYGYGNGYYGLGLYPFLGYGYYGDSYGDQQPLPERYAQPYDAIPQQDGDYYPPPIPYAMGPQQPQSAVAEPPVQPSTPITLVLKTGQKIEVQNYAIMNGMFWDFTKQNSKRIPLAQVDLAASVKATDAAGGAFPEESFGANPK